MATYVIAEAEDGHRVVFSSAELVGILDSDVIVADTMNGESLAPKQGPFRLVAPHLRSVPPVGSECSSQSP